MEPTVAVTEETSRKLRNLGFVCALLVVFRHVNWNAGSGPFGTAFRLFGTAGDLVSLAAIPFFFAASGFFLAAHVGEPGWWWRETKKRLRTLLVPYFAWSALYLLFDVGMAVVHQGNRGGTASLSPFFSASGWISTLGLDFAHRPRMQVLWFVRCLFLFVAVSPVFARVAARFRFRGLAVLYPVVLLHASLTGVHEAGDPAGFFIYGFSLEGAWYFLLGMVLRRSGSARSSLPPVPAISAVVVLAVVRCALAWRGIRPPINLSALATPVVLAALWSLCPASPWPTWLTSSSFPVYLFHTFLLPVAAFALARLRIGNPFAPPVLFSAVALGSLLAAAILRRLPAPVSRPLLGGRLPERKGLSRPWSRLVSPDRLPSVLFLLFAGFCCFFSFHGKELWNDEVWTVLLVRSHSFAETTRLTAQDVHPPLYYWLLKAVWTFFPGSVAAAKLLSALPFLAALFVCIRFHCRERNPAGACLFLFLVFAAPQLVLVATEVRMYVWAAFFVLMTHFAGYVLVQTGRRRDAVFLGVWAALCALTHYLAGLCALSVIGTTAVILLFSDRNAWKTALSRTFLAGVVSAVLFLPWTRIFVSAFSGVSAKGFWIPTAISWGEACRFLFPFRPEWGGYALAAAGAVLFAAGVCDSVRPGGDDASDRRERAGLLLFFAAPVAAMSVAMVYSRLVSPILNRHYFTIPAFAVLFFLSVGISRRLPKKPAVCIVAVLAAFASANLAISAGGRLKRNSDWNVVVRMVRDKATPGTQFVYPGTNDWVLRALLSYLRPDNPHLSDLEPFPGDFHDPRSDRRPLAEVDWTAPWCVVLRDGDESAWPAGFPEKGSFDLFRHSYWGSIRFYWSHDPVRAGP